MPEYNSKKIGVGMLIPFLHNQTGGMERQIWQLSHLLQKNNVEISFITCVRFWEIFTKKLQLKEIVDGITIYRIPGIYPPYGNKIFPLEFLIGAYFLLKKIKAKIDLIHAHQLFSSGLVAAILKNIINKPIIVKLAGGGRDGDIEDILRFPYSHWKIKKINHIDLFVAINPRILDELEKLGISKDRAAEIPNGVNIDVFKPRLAEKNTLRKNLNLPDKKLVTFIGRIIDVKQFHFLVDIWPELLKVHPDAYLIVIGKPDFTSDYASKIKLKIAKLGLNANIAFIGTVPNTHDYIAASDIFVLPSRSEGLSNALLEAASTGLPIIASDIPGNKMVIEYQKNGLLFDPSNPQELLRYLKELLSNPVMANQLGQNARQTVEAKFSLSTVTQHYINLYTKLINLSTPN